MSSTLVRVLCWVSSLYLGFHDALFLSPRRRSREDGERNNAQRSLLLAQFGADLLSLFLSLAMRSLTSFFFFLLVV